RLVGEGTVYRWVWSTCWLAAVPVFLLLVRWWRDVVFERVERVRRKSGIQAWVLANRSGWKSFFAAMVAAVHLFALGAFKVVRNWLTSFNLARRAHAYLFKRELDRLAGEKPRAESAELRREAFLSLGPDRASETWIGCVGAEQLSAFRASPGAARGGVIAVVGSRGSGKTSLLRHFLASEAGGLSIDCCEDGALARARARLEQPSGAPDSGVEQPTVVLLDNAHALVKPIRGGLRAFDEALAFARSSSPGPLWVFAIDAVVWPFLSRARDARPLFDEVITLRSWSDEQIGALLSARSAEAEITPTFEDLLEKLPPAADEIDKQEALAARKAGYFRMVWDYARGNPAMALEAWRASLREDGSSTVRVRSLVAPNSSELEALPDSALFILRAILQMDPATVSDVAKATRLAEAHVENAVRFGQSHGYLVEEAGRIRVAWSWLRSIVVLLERRHLLLVNP
ncbi:MAG TPA: ATP-binding protein, partial [Polyangiaceae bacterium]